MSRLLYFALLGLAFQARVSSFNVPYCIQSRSSLQSAPLCRVASRPEQGQTVRRALRNGGYGTKEYWDDMYRGEGDVSHSNAALFHF